MEFNENSVRLYRENYEYLPKRFVRKIDADITYILNAKIPGLSKLYLFGSCARGDLRSGSDIDLLIVTKEKLKDRVLAADIRWTLDEELDGVSTDIVFVNESTQPVSGVFNEVVSRDRKLILEVME